MIILEVEILRGMFWKGEILHFSILSIVEGLLSIISETNPFTFFNVLFWSFKLFVFLSHRLLAKLEKADRAFCFTSGMAVLSAVANLVGTGTFFYYFCCSFCNIFHLSFIMLIIYYDSLRLAMMVFSHPHYNVQSTCCSFTLCYPCFVHVLYRYLCKSVVYFCKSLSFLLCTLSKT